MYYQLSLPPPQFFWVTFQQNSDIVQAAQHQPAVFPFSSGVLTQQVTILNSNYLTIFKVYLDLVYPWQPYYRRVLWDIILAYRTILKKRISANETEICLLSGMLSV